MVTEDLITIILLIIGLFLVIIFLIFTKRGKLKIEMWPRVFGIGGAIYTFVSLMTMSILLSPISEFVNYTTTNLFWSIVFGIVGYIGGLSFVRNAKNQK